MNAIVIGEKIVCSDAEAKAIVESLNEKTPYVLNVNTLSLCLSCNGRVGNSDKSILSHYICQKCWKEMSV